MAEAIIGSAGFSGPLRVSTFTVTYVVYMSMQYATITVVCIRSMTAIA